MSGTDPIEFAAVAPELFVPDVTESVRFYTEQLGFRLLRADPPVGHGRTPFAIVVRGEAMIMLADEGMLRGRGEPVGAPRGRGIDIRIMAADVDALYAALQASGADIVAPLRDRGYGLRDFVVRDPDGFGLRFAWPTAKP
jgi:uncharacterized glyoxalase superfamily protein PhnB